MRLIFKFSIILILSAVLFANNNSFNKSYKQRLHKIRGVEHTISKGYIKFVKDLNLTVEQRFLVNDILKMQRLKIRELRREVFKSIKIDFSSFMSVESFDSEAYIKEVQRVRDEIKQAKKSIRSRSLEIQAESFKKIFEVLTPKQREKMINLTKSIWYNKLLKLY